MTKSLTTGQALLLRTLLAHFNPSRNFQRKSLDKNSEMAYLSGMQAIRSLQSAIPKNAATQRVAAFDFVAVYRWLRNSCWTLGTPSGECYHTACFIEMLFGWPAYCNRYHAWNKSPSGLILDLTASQFGRQFKHNTRLVSPNTIFDIPSMMYTEGVRLGCETWVKQHVLEWIREFKMRLDDGQTFGIQTNVLLKRIESLGV